MRRREGEQVRLTPLESAPFRTPAPYWTVSLLLVESCNSEKTKRPPRITPIPELA